MLESLGGKFYPLCGLYYKMYYKTDIFNLKHLKTIFFMTKYFVKRLNNNK